MNLHYLQHVPFEGPGSIATWAGNHKCRLTATKLYANEQLPHPDQFEALIVMGGPMSIHDHKLYPWLVREKEFIKAAIAAGKPVLGICLGAQLIADVLGAKVYKNTEKEIGWFPINPAPNLGKELSRIFPAAMTVFHWHGETFDIPHGASHLAQSVACRNQGFSYREKVIGLQFHLESTPESVRALIDNCGAELVAAPFIQSPDTMLVPAENFKTVNAIMDSLLSYLTQSA